MSYADTHPLQRTPWARYRHSLWLLTTRDLKVRYSTSALGYVWSVLDPLVMAGIYWFVFTQVFQRPVGTEPYIVFLLSALLPWMWFNGAISDSTRAFLKDAKLVRSTMIPRTIWVNRIVLSKGIEFLLSLPVLALFAIVFGATVGWELLLFPLAILLQAILTVGVALIVAPLVVFFRDLERAVKLILRFLFYASPIIYGVSNLPPELHFWAAFNPLSGIFGLYRAGFFPDELDWFNVAIAAAHVARPARRRPPRVPRQRAPGAEGDLMTDAAAAELAATETHAIRAHGLGIRFRRNRRGRRSFKDLLAGRRRRTRPGEFWALRDVSIEVRPGEAIGVVGRNGQGKSTLLKLVAGVMIADEGTVEVTGGVAPLIEITGGFVDDLTVRDNVYLTAGLHGMTRSQIDAKFDEIIEFADIGDFLDTPYKHLSSGMKVRIAFAVISQLEEPILLVDEVLAVGDKAFREKCYRRIDELLAGGRTLFFVSHNERDLRRFCTRGLYLDKGALVLDAPHRRGARPLQRRPRHGEVAPLRRRYTRIRAARREPLRGSGVLTATELRIVPP